MTVVTTAGAVGPVLRMLRPLPLQPKEIPPCAGRMAVVAVGVMAMLPAMLRAQSPAPQPGEPPCKEALFSDARFVAVDGSDANPGTEAAPWGTVQHALDLAGPGATIRLGPGVFFEPIAVRRSGTSDAPIIIEGTLGADGERRSCIDAGKAVDPTAWKPAPSIGPNVFQIDTFPFEPYLMTIDGGEVPHVHRAKPVAFSGRWAIGAELRKDPPWANLAMEVLALPEDHRVPRRDGSSIPFWETLGAVYAHHPDPKAGVTYLRMADGADPRERSITVSPEGAVVTIIDVGHIVLRGIALSGGNLGVLVSGEDAAHIRIENCSIVHGRSRVHITERASHVDVVGNDMTMGAFFKTRPGAWGGPGYGEVHAQREYLYNFFKQLHGRGTSSDDCSVRIDGKVRHLRIEGNRMDGGLIGIRLRQVRDLLVRNNHIQAHSSVGIVVADAAMDVHLDGNRLHDNNIHLRFQRLNCGDRRRVYVYRNRLSQPSDVGTHIYCHAMTQREGYPDAEVTLYHNTFRNGSRGFTVPHARRMPRGVPEFRLFNNIFASRHDPYHTQPESARQDDSVGAFAFNWVGGEYPLGVPAWFGEGNILAEDEPPWDAASASGFELPEGHPARGAGIDLSRPFTVDGTAYHPLPGMMPGYFRGEHPDLGAVQHP